MCGKLKLFLTLFAAFVSVLINNKTFWILQIITNAFFYNYTFGSFIIPGFLGC